jgi:hypothetical protein
MTIARIFSLGIVITLVSIPGARSETKNNKVFLLKMQLNSQGHIVGSAQPHGTVVPRNIPHNFPHIATPHVK